MQHRIQGDALWIAFPGDILSTGVRDLRAQVQGILERPENATSSWRVLELDLTRAKIIDSMGLNLLVGILKQARERGKTMRLTIHDSNLDRLLRFTRLHEHADVVRV